jgi:hypothetical protein
MFEAALKTTKQLFRQSKNSASRPADTTSPIGLPGIRSVDNTPAILECAFVRPVYLVVSSLDAYSKDPLLTFAMTAAIVQFNVAIAYHLHAVAISEDRTSDRNQMLSQAKTFYAKAQAVLHQIGVSKTQSTGYAAFDFLSLTILNNQGQIAYFLSQYQDSQQHFQNMLVYAASVQTNCLDAAASDVLTWLMGSCLSHTLVLQAPSIAAAA